MSSVKLATLSGVFGYADGLTIVCLNMCNDAHSVSWLSIH